jgi:predicted nucleic acid-binding protein
VIFFDTNVLIYSIVNLDKEKQKVSDSLVGKAIKEKVFSISPLVLSEFILMRINYAANLSYVKI